jgi:hypothetical protein
MLVAVDACQAGAMASDVVAQAIPGVAFLTSSDAFEGSVATNWDPTRRAWLADQFSYALSYAALQAPERPLLDVYRSLYVQVPGSHVTLYNADLFADLAKEPLRSFVAP